MERKCVQSYGVFLGEEYPRLVWTVESIAEAPGGELNGRVIITVTEEQTRFTKSTWWKRLFNVGEDVVADQKTQTRRFIGKRSKWKEIPSFERIYRGAEWLECVWERWGYANATAPQK